MNRKVSAAVPNFHNKLYIFPANTADGRRFIPPTYGQGLPPSASAHLPPHTLGIPTEPTYPPHAPPPHQANVAAVANVGAVVEPNDHHRMAMMVSFICLFYRVFKVGGLGGQLTT